MGIFHSTVDGGTKSAGLLSGHIFIKTGNVFPANMGDSQHKEDRRSASMCKHANTGRPVPSMWLRFQQAEKLWSPTYHFALADKSRVKSRGGLRWEGGDGRNLLTNWGGEDSFSVWSGPGCSCRRRCGLILSHYWEARPQVMSCAWPQMATLTHDRPLPFSRTHCNYCRNVREKPRLLVCEVQALIQQLDCWLLSMESYLIWPQLLKSCKIASNVTKLQWPDKMRLNIRGCLSYLNVFTVFVSPLPPWRSPGWNRSSLCPGRPVVSRPSQPCSGPNAEGRWLWRASPALQVLRAEHVRPSKQQFPKGIMKKKKLWLLNTTAENCRLTQQGTKYRLCEVSQTLTRRNTMSVILHVGVRQSTCLRWLRPTTSMCCRDKSWQRIQV